MLFSVIRGERLRFLIQGSRIAFVGRTNEIESLASLLKTSALVGLFGLLAFLGISLFLARWALRPIEKSWNQQRQFVADASHELKTPCLEQRAAPDNGIVHRIVPPRSALMQSGEHHRAAGIGRVQTREPSTSARRPPLGPSGRMDPAVPREFT